jgi:PEP-CTERM motif
VLKARALLVILCLGVFGVATSHADSVIGSFDLSCPSDSCGPGQNSPTSVSAVGQIILTLNANGTIAASLEHYGSADIFGFGFNSSALNISESGFSPTSPSNDEGWGDDFGSQISGFACLSCGLTESWTIDGDYTSVDQVLNGGSGKSSVDFFLFDTDGNEWGADAEPLTATPEPGSLLLMGTGALGLIGAVRRRLAR